MDYSLSKGKRFETLPSAFVALLPGLVLASPEATLLTGSSQSLTVLNPDYFQALSAHNTVTR